MDDRQRQGLCAGCGTKLSTVFVRDKSDEANLMKTSGEPGRTRTSNPLIKSCFCSTISGLLSTGKYLSIPRVTIFNNQS
jgi:hypothetical protein